MLSICAWRLHSSLTPGRQPPDDTTTGCTLNTRKKKEGSGASYVLSCRIGPQAHVVKRKKEIRDVGSLTVDTLVFPFFSLVAPSGSSRCTIFGLQKKSNPQRSVLHLMTTQGDGKEGH